MPDSLSHPDAVKCRFQTARNALFYQRIPEPASGFGLHESQQMLQAETALVDGLDNHRKRSVFVMVAINSSDEPMQCNSYLPIV
ncbi:hypothetical protein [Desulfatirhabdium butyrativorans]|uniref:hypothetical protein n=1 Tax=Desulfatirhabdium butyrativorans TaxID=340467 RepID=UPI0012EB460F|nr:hypothetical protein [Desulfatirhabdium butyrativorans]